MELDPTLLNEVLAAPTYWVAYDAGKKFALCWGVPKSEQNLLMSLVRETFLKKKSA